MDARLSPLPVIRSAQYLASRTPEELAALVTQPGTRGLTLDMIVATARAVDAMYGALRAIEQITNPPQPVTIDVRMEGQRPVIPAMTGPVSDVPADRIDEAIWRLNIDGLSQYDIERIVRVVVLPEVAAERQRLHDRIEAALRICDRAALYRFWQFEAAIRAALVSPVSESQQ